MSLILCTALCLQVLSCALMRWRLGQGWLRRPVCIIVMAAVIYHGLSEILLAVPSIRVWDVGRIGISQLYIDQATLVSISWPAGTGGQLSGDHAGTGCGCKSTWLTLYPAHPGLATVRDRLRPAGHSHLRRTRLQ